MKKVNDRIKDKVCMGNIDLRELHNPSISPAANKTSKSNFQRVWKITKYSLKDQLHIL